MNCSPKKVASVEPQEIAHFSQHAACWWDKSGIFASLHELTRPRVQYIMEQCECAFDGKPINELCFLDLGCGGGLITESLTKKGVSVTGVDASEATIRAAQQHALQNNLDITYQVGSAESLQEKGQQFDVILALDVVEHVADVESFLRAISNLLKKNGVLVLSTLNRTRKSFLFSIAGAEYMIGKVPIGTHDYEKFIKPHELHDACQVVGLTPIDITGLVYRPFRRIFELEKGKNSINYFLTATKP